MTSHLFKLLTLAAVFVLLSTLIALLPYRSAQAACNCAGTTGLCTGAHMVLHAMFVPETVEINLDDMGLMRTKFVYQGGGGTGIPHYTVYWCTCNNPPDCHYHTTSSTEREDDGKTFELGGCNFLNFPPSQNSCETDNC